MLNCRSSIEMNSTDCRPALGLVCCLAFLGAEAARAQPRAVVPEPSVELGEVAKGDVVFHEFEIRNEGDSELVIESARPTCGCTIADFDRSIEPGKSGVIRAKLDTRTLVGRLHTTIRVATSDPLNAELELAITATVRPYLGARPGSARWNTVETETEGTIGITLWPLDGKPFEVSEVVVTYGDITAKVRAAADEERYEGYEGRQWRVDLTLGAEPPIGAIQGYAEIRTTHPEQRNVHIPVSGFVRPLVFVSPSVTDLGSFSLSGPRRARYEVRNFGSAPMTIERVALDLAGVTTEITTQEEGYIYEVAAVFDPERVPSGEFDGEIVVHTNLAKRPTIRWQIKGTVEDAATVSGGSPTEK